MNESSESRRRFLKAAGLSAGAVFLSSGTVVAESGLSTQSNDSPAASSESGSSDYTLHIKTSPIEIAPNRIISATTYNGQFPGPLLRFKEGQQVTVDVYNDTDTPEQLHWHGQMVPPDVDGASEEGTPFIPAHGKRRIAFTPRPAGFRFYHTHNRAGADLAAGQYGGPSWARVYRAEA
jgi:FtsP/CotA-like multicopper oxidase with cupredoxin domain